MHQIHTVNEQPLLRRPKGQEHLVTTTSDEITTPSSPTSSSSEGEQSVAETELMMQTVNDSLTNWQRSAVVQLTVNGMAVKPKKPPRHQSVTSAHVVDKPLMDDQVLSSKPSSSKSSSVGMVPAPPPPPMPPIQAANKVQRHVGHVTGITETLQNRMANAAVSAASEAIARRIAKF